MANHALVVGSQTEGLEGPNRDAALVASALREVGFTVDLRNTPDSASRAGILDGYECLIANVGQKADAAVFYYSGHGGRAIATDPAARPLQCLVPTDFHRSTPDEFYGLLDIELSVLLARLTQRTPNATVILDCCHAAAMSRDTIARPKALFHPAYVDLQNHLGRIAGTGSAIDLDPSGNPDAVRLVAAGQSQSAYERLVDGQAIGTFTEVLLAALREARGQRVTWDAVGRIVRERVLAIHPGQRADIEGPRRRYLFETVEAPRDGAVTIVTGELPRTAVLRAGRLHGLHPGDEYSVVPSGAPDDPVRRIATAVVTKVETAESVAALQLVPPATVLPDGAQAFRLRSAAPKRAIRVVADGALRETIIRAIAATERFTIAGDDPHASILATVTLEAGTLSLLYPSGVLVVPPAAWSTDGLDQLVANLRMLAAAQAMRELESDTDQLPGTAVAVSWGRVDDNQPIELPPAGALLAIGSRLYVKVTNRHRLKRKLFVSIFDIGVAQRIQLLTSAWPAGYELEPGETFTLGEDAHGRFKGLELGWSSALPLDMVRTETLAVIVTEQPCDLSALETPGARSAWAVGARRGTAAESALQQLVRQFQYGGTRDLRPTGDAGGHIVRYLQFELSPWRLPAPGQPFLIDDRPPESVRPFAARGVARASRSIAIRLVNLAVHDVRTLFGAGDIRVDTLVVTRAAKSGAEPYRAETLRFKAIRDGDALPFDNALIYHGEVNEFVDLRVWVSRDRDDSLSLAALLRQQANSADFKDAATALLAVTALAASAAPTVAAIGAVATLTSIAWSALAAALPRTVGLYQTSLLAGEGDGFGAGRHPPQGALRAQGFSFSYEVVPLD